MRRAVQILLGTVLVTPSAYAEGTLLDDDTWKYRSRCDLAVDGGLVVGFPAALPTGLTTGLGGGDPLLAFSIVAAGGFTPEAALAALLRGELPAQDPATCSELPLDEATVSIALVPAGALAEVACEPRRDDSSVRYREPPDESPNLDGHTFACTQIPSFEGGNEDTMQLVVASNAMDRCKGLTHYVLNGCDDDPLCALPEGDLRASPPVWWPCPVVAARAARSTSTGPTTARSPP